jgi:hypothetical protein
LKPAQANSSYFEKTFTKIGLAEWLKVKALSSSPNTAKKKKSESCQAPVAYTYNPSYLGG